MQTFNSWCWPCKNSAYPSVEDKWRCVLRLSRSLIPLHWKQEVNFNINQKGERQGAKRKAQSSASKRLREVCHFLFFPSLWNCWRILMLLSILVDLMLLPNHIDILSMDGDGLFIVIGSFSCASMSIDS